jgi:hypothetical protein
MCEVAALAAALACGNCGRREHRANWHVLSCSPKLARLFDWRGCLFLADAVANVYEHLFADRGIA